MWVGNPRSPRWVTAETCRDVQRELDRPDPDPGGGGGEGPGGGNPGDGGGDPNDDCGVNPNDPTCPVDCDYNPNHPDCGGLITVCWGESEDEEGEDEEGEDEECTAWEFSTVPGGGSRTRRNTGRQSYSFTLSAEADVTVSLTGMNRDIDCRVNASSCTNYWGTRDDSWSGRLGSGTHRLTVYPYNRPTGNWTVSISATVVRRAGRPSPVTHRVPFTVSRQDVSGDQTHRFSLLAETRVGVTLTGMNRDIDCRVNRYVVSGLPPGLVFDAATRGVSGRLPRVSVYTNYAVFYTVTDSLYNGASAMFTAGVRP